jgi:hypothetical protein
MTPRYKLRTLLILAAILPPLMWFGWGKYQAWKAEQEQQRALADQRVLVERITDLTPVEDLEVWFVEGKPGQPQPGTGAQPVR